MEVPCSPLLYPHPPEAGELSEPPRKALAEGFEMLLTGLRVLWILSRITQGYADKTSLISPEGGTVDARQTSQEISAAGLGKSPDPSPDTSTVSSTDAVLDFTI